MVAKVDMDGSGLLNFPEFLAMMGYKVTQAAHSCRHNNSHARAEKGWAFVKAQL